jgi:hypothetical protein
MPKKLGLFLPSTTAPLRFEPVLQMLTLKIKASRATASPYLMMIVMRK